MSEILSFILLFSKVIPQRSEEISGCQVRVGWSSMFHLKHCRWPYYSTALWHPTSCSKKNEWKLETCVSTWGIKCLSFIAKFQQYILMIKEYITNVFLSDNVAMNEIHWRCAFWLCVCLQMLTTMTHNN